MKKINLTCIVDDDEISQYSLTKLIEVNNFSEKVEAFYNGEEALKSLKPRLNFNNQLPDIILLDLNMPIMDGWEFLDEFINLKLTKKILIYIVSSSINEEDHKRAASYNSVSNFFVKPIKRIDLEFMKRDFFK